VWNLLIVKGNFLQVVLACFIAILILKLHTLLEDSSQFKDHVLMLFYLLNL